MKSRLCFLALICALLVGCGTTPEAPKPQKPPAKADIAAFTIVENFLRAAYCPAMTDFKIEIVPNYNEAPTELGLTPTLFDEQLKAGMDLLKNYQGDVYVRMSIGIVGFCGLFDRTTGKLGLFEKEPQGISSPWTPILVETRETPATQNSDKFAVGDTLLVVVATDPRFAKAGYFFELPKGTKTFRLRFFQTAENIQCCPVFPPPPPL
jgi:hypothetical protein